MRKKAEAPAAGWTKRTFWLEPDLADELRERAFRDRRSQSDIVREAIRRLLGRKSAQGAP